MVLESSQHKWLPVGKETQAKNDQALPLNCRPRDLLQSIGDKPVSFIYFLELIVHKILFLSDQC